MSVSERSSIVRSTPTELLNNYYAISSQINIEGHPDEMKSSPVRRTFCLIVLFDLVFSVLVWICHVQILSESITFKTEVIGYKFNISLFDTAVMAALRFTFLEIMYGGLKSKLPWWIALSTSITTAFVICKMFKNYFSNDGKKNTQVTDYIIILASLILCWVETFFLVYRMLPKERAAQQMAEFHRAMTEPYIDSRGSLASDTSPRLGGHQKISTTVSSDEEFFSPKVTRPPSPNQIRIKELQQKANDVQERAWEIIRNNTGWTYATGDAVKGFVTYKELVSFKGKVFKIETLLNASAQLLYNDMIHNYSQSPSWNHHVRLVKKVEVVSDNVDIIYNVSNEALKGYISPRDFVLLRTWTMVGNCYLISMTSVVHDECPPQKDIVRGEYGLGAIFLERSSFDVGQCKCIWLMNSDIKGKLFKSVVDRAVPGILLEIIDGLRYHCSTLVASV